MTGVVFKQYTATLNMEMAEAGRHILLLMDNASSRMLPVEATEQEDLKIQKLSNITLLLSPNTTSVVQPLDAGIIHAFKAHYRTLLMRWLLTEVENGPSGSDLSKRAPDLQHVNSVIFFI